MKLTYIDQMDEELGDTRETHGVVYPINLEPTIYKKMGIEPIGRVVIEEDDSEPQTYRVMIPLLEDDEDDLDRE